MIASSNGAERTSSVFAEFDLGIQRADWLRGVMTRSIRFLDGLIYGSRAAIDGNAVFALEAVTAEVGASAAAPRGRHRRESG
jgi:uncharacterized membrane protein